MALGPACQASCPSREDSAAYGWMCTVRTTVLRYSKHAHCTYTTYAYLLTLLLYATEKCDEGAADAETSLTKKSKK